VKCRHRRVRPSPHGKQGKENYYTRFGAAFELSCAELPRRQLWQHDPRDPPARARSTAFRPIPSEKHQANAVQARFKGCVRRHPWAETFCPRHPSSWLWSFYVGSRGQRAFVEGPFCPQLTLKRPVLAECEGRFFSHNGLFKHAHMNCVSNRPSMISRRDFLQLVWLQQLCNGASSFGNCGQNGRATGAHRRTSCWKFEPVSATSSLIHVTDIHAQS